MGLWMLCRLLVVLVLCTPHTLPTERPCSAEPAATQKLRVLQRSAHIPSASVPPASCQETRQHQEHAFLQMVSFLDPKGSNPLRSQRLTPSWQHIPELNCSSWSAGKSGTVQGRHTRCLPVQQQRSNLSLEQTTSSFSNEGKILHVSLTVGGCPICVEMLPSLSQTQGFGDTCAELPLQPPTPKAAEL